MTITTLKRVDASPQTDQPTPLASLGLEALERRLHEDLERLCLPAEDWLRRAEDDPVLDVAIVGGGMSGLAAAAALVLAGVRKVQVFDRNPAGQEGPWVTHARMLTLRSPKQLTGPALGLPSLTFRAWYEAQFGSVAWESLGRIPRVQWQDYLNWYRSVLNLPVQHLSLVDGITLATLPDGQQGVSFQVSQHSAYSTATRKVLARHLVLATGMDGLGGPSIPALADALPRSRWHHTSERIDFVPWRGQRIAIVGGGDSALDAAATAAEAGVAQVDVFIRGKDFTRVNYWKAMTHPGHYYGFNALSPEERQPLLDFLKAQHVPPSQDTVKRVALWQQIRLHFSSPVQRLSVAPNHALELVTPHASHAVDHVVFATGYATNLAARPELKGLAEHIRFWSDRTPALQSSFPLGGFPDLEADYSLREKTPGACPVLGRVHLFTGAALLSQGKLTGDIPGISHGAQRLSQGIVARLYAADREAQFQAVKDYNELEVHGHEWKGNLAMTQTFVTLQDTALVRLAQVPADTPLAAALEQREEAVLQAEASRQVLFETVDVARLSLQERFFFALKTAEHHQDGLLVEHYKGQLTRAGGAPDVDAKLQAALDHVRTLATAPVQASAEQLEALAAAGWSADAILTLAQIVAFVSFQSRYLAGLRLIAGTASPVPPGAAVVTAGAWHLQAQTRSGKPAPVQFTREQLGWEPWLAPRDHATLSAQETEKLEKAGHLQSSYFMLLARDLPVLEHRTRTDKGIFYSHDGLSRAERELAATVTSKVNGCIYCASVHARKAEQLSHETQAIDRLLNTPAGGDLGAGQSARWQALIAFAAQLSATPSAVGGQHLTKLRELGFTDFELLDLVGSVAFFSWANRLMLTLGEPYWPAN